MKQGDIVMVFGDPINLKYPIGQAKLIRKISDCNDYVQQWNVEFLDDEGHTYPALIKKDGKSK